MAVIATMADARTITAVNHEGGEPWAHNTAPWIIGGRARVRMSWGRTVQCATNMIAMHHQGGGPCGNDTPPCITAGGEPAHAFRAANGRHWP